MSQNAVHPTAANEARLQAAARQRNQQNAPSLPFQAADTAEQQRFNGLLKQAEKLQAERAESQKQGETQAAARADAALDAASPTASKPNGAENAAPDTAEREAQLQAQQADAALLAALTPTTPAEGKQPPVAAEASASTGPEQLAREAAFDAATEAAQAEQAEQAAASAEAAQGSANQPPDAAAARKPDSPAELLQRWQAQERSREALARDPSAGLPASDGAAPLRDITAVPNTALSSGIAAGTALAGGIAAAGAAPVQDPLRGAGLHSVSASSSDTALEAALQTSLDGGATGSGTSGQDSLAGQSSPPGNPGGNPVAAARPAGSDGFAALLNTSPPAADSPASQPASSAMAQALGDGFNQLGVQVSLWASQNLRRASLSLQGADGQPIEVDVTLKDGQASLAFRTDDSAARAALQNFGQQALSQMLEQYGLDLSALSVDTRASDGTRQGAGQGQAPASQPSLAAARALRGLSGEGVAGAANGLGWTSKTSSSLDVYV